MPAQSDWWAADSRTELCVPLGRAGAVRLLEMRLGADVAQHVLIAGMPGSGKSTLLHALIVNLALHYSPEQVELYLVDFKKGVEFKPYAEHKLPHARVIAVESEREFGLSVLQCLDAELKTRGERYPRRRRRRISASYRKATEGDPAGPLATHPPDRGRVPGVLRRGRPASPSESQLLLDRLVRQGRAFGIHVILGSQTLAGAYSLAQATLGQMAVRIALQCSDADGQLILGNDNAGARLLSRPGEAIYNDANGAEASNNVFQTAYLEDEAARAVSPTPAAVGRGAEGGAVAAGGVRGERRAGSRAQPAAVRAAPGPGASPAGRATKVWLGEPVAIADPRSRPSSSVNRARTFSSWAAAMKPP